jgi:hypothetical protein
MFNFNINEYSFEDMKKVFGISENETMTDNELDVRIASILFNAKSQLSKEELSKVKNFLPILKEKYKQLVNLNNIEINNIHPLTESMKAIMTPNKFLDKNEHMVIERTTEPEYTIRNFSIYSCNRDSSAFPYASQFEVDVPTDIRDITLLQLQDYNMSFFMKNFSSWYHNTKLSFSVTSTIGPITYDSDGSSSTDDDYVTRNLSINQPMTITLEDGFYNSEATLQIYLIEKMNAKLYDTIATEEGNNNILNGTIDSNKNISNIKLGNSEWSFKSVIDPISKKIVIYNERLTFKLHFDNAEAYDNNKHQTKKMYNLKSYWGLGYFLGFNKEIYTSQNVEGTSIYGPDLTYEVNAILAPKMINIDLNAVSYLEIDGFNYAYQTNEHQGEVNSYFARIPVGYSSDGIRISDTGGFDKAVVSYERLNKLKLKLRLFNGVLLDMTDQDFDITLSFYCKK